MGFLLLSYFEVAAVLSAGNFPGVPDVPLLLLWRQASLL
jgi:hypothetical protein